MIEEKYKKRTESLETKGAAIVKRKSWQDIESRHFARVYFWKLFNAEIRGSFLRNMSLKIYLVL